MTQISADELMARLATQGAFVLEAMERTLRSLAAVDAAASAEAAQLGQRAVDEADRLEAAAVEAITQQPAASARAAGVVTINHDLARIATLSIRCAQLMLPLSRQKGYRAPDNLRKLGDAVVAKLREAIDAIRQPTSAPAPVAGNGEDDVVNALAHHIVQDTLTLMSADNGREIDLSHVAIVRSLQDIARLCAMIRTDAGRLTRRAMRLTGVA
jgi:hypothetical protein